MSRIGSTVENNPSGRGSLRLQQTIIIITTTTTTFITRLVASTKFTTRVTTLIGSIMELAFERNSGRASRADWRWVVSSVIRGVEIVEAKL